LVASILVAAPVAQAETVVLYPVTGSADGATLTVVRDHLRTTITGLGHTIVEGTGDRPTTVAQFDAAATAQHAVYVVLADVTPHPGHYDLHVLVGSVDASRVEELMVDVLLEEEDARLRDVIGAMLRPQGLGDDALRLSAEETAEQRAHRLAVEAAARQAELDRQRQQQEAEQAALDAERRAEEAERQRQEEDARQQAEQAARQAAEEAQHRWDGRQLYGAGGAWMVQLGGEGAGGVIYGPHNSHVPGGGGLGFVQARVARLIDGTGGLELRAGADVFFGLGAGMNILVGATYQWSPFLDPIHIGVIAELGLSIAFTGPRDAGFMFRAGAVASWSPTEHLYLELALPEIGVMTNGSGALVFGASLRIGYRFD
jgi:hypothetical protein